MSLPRKECPVSTWKPPPLAVALATALVLAAAPSAAQPDEKLSEEEASMRGQRTF
jgi:hypothetical protein